MSRPIVPTVVPDEQVIVPENGDPVLADTLIGMIVGAINPSIQALANKINALFQGRVYVRAVHAGDPAQAGKAALPSDGQVVCRNLSASAAVNGGVGFFSAEVEAAEFDAIGGTGRADYEPNRIFFRNTTTGATGSNPPFGTVVANELRALGMPKAWGYVVTDGAGGFSVLTAQGATYGVKSALAAASYVEIELTTPMDSTNYCIQCNGVAGALTSMPVIPQIASTTKFRINTTGGVNPTATSCQFHFVIFGQQST